MKREMIKEIGTALVVIALAAICIAQASALGRLRAEAKRTRLQGYADGWSDAAGIPRVRLVFPRDFFSREFVSGEGDK